MRKQYYKTKWDGLTFDEKIELSKQLENKLIYYLVDNCGFSQIIPTRDSIKTKAKEKGLILPDLMGLHKSGKEYFIELKAKNRRMAFNDNGIDYIKAEAYLKIQTEFNKKVLLVFIDDEKEWIEQYPYIYSWFKDENFNCTYYGNWIDKLYYDTPETPITITQANGKKIICFPLKNMKKIEELFFERQTSLNFGVID